MVYLKTNIFATNEKQLIIEYHENVEIFVATVDCSVVGSLNVHAKKKTEKVKSDRELWAGILYQMAAPVLSNMSEGKLQENMLVELSPTWDGRDKRVTYMECFGRLMAGLAPWLSLPDDDTGRRNTTQTIA